MKRTKRRLEKSPSEGQITCRADMWIGEPPPFDEEAARRTYEMNKHLLSENDIIITGPTYWR